jgi:hypothetical protein
MAFNSGGIGSPPPVIPPVKEKDPAIQEASAEAARRRKLARGVKSTILGSQMMAENAPAMQETFGA